MELPDLYEMQKDLDARIIAEKKLEGLDLLPNTVLALQVEIAYLANLWRGFKHWSNDREPRYERKCHACKGKGRFEEADCDCLYCGASGVEERPLIEKYVDCLSFFLQIARQLDLSADDLYQSEDVLEYDTNIVLTELLHNVGLIIGDHFLLKKPDDITKWRKDHLRTALFIFYGLGEQRFGFTFEEIAAAYVTKHEVNHKRQSSGY